MERMKFGLAVVGQFSVVAFVVTGLAGGWFGVPIFGGYTTLAIVIFWLIAGAALFLKCGNCRRSFYFDKKRFKGGFSPFPGAAPLKRLSRVCRSCGYNRLNRQG